MAEEKKKSNARGAIPGSSPERSSLRGSLPFKRQLTGKQRTMRNLLIAVMLLAAIPTLAAEKLQVWVQADPGQPNNTDLQDSAQDIRKKFKSKILELAESPEKADITMTVIARAQLPGCPASTTLPGQRQLEFPLSTYPSSYVTLQQSGNARCVAPPEGADD